MRVDKDYRFEAADETSSLRDLFNGCGQLLVYHFMFAPDWDEGCPSCSFWVDSSTIPCRSLPTGNCTAEPTTSPASTTLPRRAPGVSAFAVGDSGEVLHTYSTYSRGLDPIDSGYQLLDLTPHGRDEDRLEWSMAWLRRHDAYDD